MTALGGRGPFPEADPGFWLGGPSGVLILGGRLCPKSAKNSGFPFKLPENCMILKNKILGASTPPHPWIRFCFLRDSAKKCFGGNFQRKICDGEDKSREY